MLYSRHDIFYQIHKQSTIAAIMIVLHIRADKFCIYAKKGKLKEIKR